MNDIVAKLNALEERIEAACLRSGRKRSDIQLMAVTKFHPLESVEAAFNAGIRLFGENRMQEAKDKFARFWDKHPRSGIAASGDGSIGVSLHLIGSLQRNKAKAAAAIFDCIQSVDRESLITELGNLTTGRECPLMVMLEYHTGEDSKAGFQGMDSLLRAAEKALSFPGLRPIGLMTMAPFTDEEAAVRSSFKKLAEAGRELEKRFPGGFWSCLSMGMTGDFEIAIEEGSTLIRIGTAIFGERSA